MGKIHSTAKPAIPPLFHESSLYAIEKSRTNYLLRTDLQGRVLSANEAFARHFDPKRQSVNQPYQNSLSGKDARNFKQVLQECSDQPGEPFSVELRTLVNEKLCFFTRWEFIGLPDQEGEVTEIQGIGHDITDAIDSEKQLYRTNQLNRYLLSISTQFIDTDSASLRSDITQALENITNFLGFQRGLIYLRDEGLLQGLLAYEYSDEELPPIIDAARILTLDNLQWWKPIIERNEPLEVLAVDNLPDKAYREKLLLNSLEVKSLVAVPIIYQQQLKGYAVFVSITEPSWWNSELIEPLKLLGTILGSAFHHVRLNQELSESRSEYKLLADTVADMVSKHDLAGVYNYVSPSCESLTGFTQNELLGRSALERIHPEDLPRAYDNLKSIMEGSVTRYQYRKLRKDGEYRWMEISAKVIDDGEKKEIIASTRDVHQYKLTEEANAKLLSKSQQLNEKLQESQHKLEYTLARTQELNELLLRSEKKFRSLTEKSFDAITVYDKEGRITYASPSVTNVIGYKVEEMIGTYARDYIYPEDLPLVQGIFHSALGKPQQRVSSLSRIVRKDGKVIWVESIMTNLLMDENIQGLVSNFRDVTEQRESEQAISEYSERLAVATESANIGIWDWYIPENRLIWDERTLNMYGIDNEENLSYSELWDEIIHPDDRQLVQDEIDAALRGDRNYDTEYRIVQYKSHQIRCIKSYANVTREDGEPIRVTGVNLDITSIRDAERQLRENLAALEKSNAELDQFVYSTSHNLRSPLASVLGLVALLEGTEDSDEKDQYLRLIESSIHRLDETIKEIIEYSRNSRIELNVERIHFQEIIADVLDSLYFLRNSINIHITLDIVDEITLRSDASRIRTIFTNLLSNAIRYFNPHTEQPRVVISIQPYPKGIRILVRDNGIGIEKGVQEDVFDMFFRATTNTSGSGLGLYIVKEAVIKLGGYIFLASQKGIGTTFALYLPSNEGRNIGQ